MELGALSMLVAGLGASLSVKPLSALPPRTFWSLPTTGCAVRSSLPHPRHSLGNPALSFFLSLPILDDATAANAACTLPLLTLSNAILALFRGLSLSLLPGDSGALINLSRLLSGVLGLWLSLSVSLPLPPGIGTSRLLLPPELEEDASLNLAPELRLFVCTLAWLGALGDGDGELSLENDDSLSIAARFLSARLLTLSKSPPLRILAVSSSCPTGLSSARKFASVNLSRVLPLPSEFVPGGLGNPLLWLRLSYSNDECEDDGDEISGGRSGIFLLGENTDDENECECVCVGRDSLAGVRVIVPLLDVVPYDEFVELDGVRVIVPGALFGVCGSTTKLALFNGERIVAALDPGLNSPSSCTVCDRVCVVVLPPIYMALLGRVRPPVGRGRACPLMSCSCRYRL